MKNPEMRKFAQLVKAAGVEACSGDETDEDAPREAPRYNRIAPLWRSDDLAALLWRLDASKEAHDVNFRGRASRKAGGHPRHRVPTARAVEMKPAKQLPKNCYRAEWLERRTAWETEELEVLPAIYNFQVRFLSAFILNVALMITTRCRLALSMGPTPDYTYRDSSYAVSIGECRPNAMS